MTTHNSPENTLKRITKELKDLRQDPIEAGTAGPVDDDNLFFWDGILMGPEGSPYAQKKFYFTVDFPKNYPFKPFTIVFATPIFHPNISLNGEVRLADLEHWNWSPVTIVRHAMLSLQAALSDPNLEEGCVLNEEAAGLYLRDRQAFGDKVQQGANLDTKD